MENEKKVELLWEVIAQKQKELEEEKESTKHAEAIFEAMKKKAADLEGEVAIRGQQILDLGKRIDKVQGELNQANREKEKLEASNRLLEEINERTQEELRAEKEKYRQLWTVRHPDKKRHREEDYDPDGFSLNGPSKEGKDEDNG